MNETLTQPEVELHTGTDPDKVAHYVKKDSILPAVVEGTSLEALCGHVFVPKRDPKSLPICQGCKAIYDDNLAVSMANKFKHGGQHYS